MENFKKKNRNWAFGNSVREKYSTDCLEKYVREKYVEQKNPMQNLLEKVTKWEKQELYWGKEEFLISVTVASYLRRTVMQTFWNVCLN